MTCGTLRESIWAEWATGMGYLQWRLEGLRVVAVRVLGRAGVGVLTAAGATVVAAGPVQGVEV